MKKENFAQKWIDLLRDLKKAYPTRDLSWHISGMLAEWDTNDCWGVSDKELFRALEKYSTEISLEEDTDDISKIIADGVNLDAMMSEPEEDEY